MAIIYRTAGAWGAGQGSNLSAAQVDNNFYELDQRIVEIEENPPEANSIESIEVVGTQMTIFLTDTTALGPFTLPTAVLHWRGEWAVATTYNELDLVLVENVGLFMVLHDHESDPTAFDPDATNEESQPLYFLIVGVFTQTFIGLTDTPEEYPDFASGDEDVYILELTTDNSSVVFTRKTWFETHFIDAVPSADQVVFRLPCPTSLHIPDSLAGSSFYLEPGFEPTDADVDLSLRVNGVEVGIIRIKITTGEIQTFVSDNFVFAGDVIEVVCPTVPDASFARFAMSLRFYWWNATT